MNLDKVKAALKACNNPDTDCNTCGYRNNGYRKGCTAHCSICKDALSCINALQDALALLKAQEVRHRLEVHNIGNVDIPEGVTWEQFQAVMNNVVDALEHTDKGESWPYEDTKRKAVKQND